MTTTIGAHLYIWDDRFLYTTAGMTSDSTQRHTLTLLLAMDAGGSFTLEEDDGRSARYSAALIGHGVARRLATPDSALLSLNFDPQSYEYHTLKAFLGRAPVRAVEARLDDALRNEMRAAGVGVLDGATLFRLTTRLAHAITGYRPIRLSMDMRVLHVAHKIKRSCRCKAPWKNWHGTSVCRRTASRICFPTSSGCRSRAMCCGPRCAARRC